MATNVEKIGVAQLEHEKQDSDAGHPTSAFASLSSGQCIRKFWRLYTTGLGVAMAGM